ncbi:MAG: hypothetical protein Q8896_04350, partial [Bacteroidota bacterium]|nr:hypothetical protein [Bacteroidota bacterium]
PAHFGQLHFLFKLLFFNKLLLFSGGYYEILSLQFMFLFRIFVVRNSLQQVSFVLLSGWQTDRSFRVSCR